MTQMFSKVMLRSEKGEYYPQRFRNEDGNYVARKTITALGFQKLNNWMGVSFSSPDTLQIGSETVGNPHIERTGKTINRVATRRIGIGRNAAGVLMAMDLTVTYDLDDYAGSEIFDAWKPGYNQKQPQPWGRIVGDPKSQKIEGHERIVELPGEIYLIVDLTNGKVQGLYSQLMQRQKFAERNAVSICERNILKKFVGTAFADDEGYVNLVHWSQPDRTRDQMKRIFDKVQKGEVKIEGEDVQLERGMELVEYEEAGAILAGEGEDAPVSDQSDDELQKPRARSRKNI